MEKNADEDQSKFEEMEALVNKLQARVQELELENSHLRTSNENLKCRISECTELLQYEEQSNAELLSEIEDYKKELDDVNER